MTKNLSLLCLPLIFLAILLTVYPQTNYALFSIINQAAPLQSLWMTITNMGDGLFLGCLLFIVLRKNTGLLTNALICALFIHYSVKFAKIFYAVLRPEHVTDVIHVITLGPPLNLTNYAMPSGHTASAFMAAVFITRAYSLQGWKLWAIFSSALLIGISRIAVGAHWPADVAAGAALGITFGLLCTHEKLALTHSSIHYISCVLYLPFIYLSIRRALTIHDPISLLSEGVIVGAGLVALAIWVLHLTQIFLAKRTSTNQAQ